MGSAGEGNSPLPPFPPWLDDPPAKVLEVPVKMLLGLAARGRQRGDVDGVEDVAPAAPETRREDESLLPAGARKRARGETGYRILG